MQTWQQGTHEVFSHRNSTPHSDLIMIRRDFRVPVVHLFDAFKTQEALKEWWWPKNFYADRIDLDFRKGGQFFFNMKSLEPGFDVGGGGMTGKFEEIIENVRIVFTDNFADKDGNKITAREAKMPGDWPDTIYTTFEFKACDANTTRMCLFQEGVPNEMRDDCIQGWMESFDKLEKYLMNSNQ